MNVDFRVENVVETQVSTKATVDGEEQMVHAQGLEVELVPAQSRHSSVTLRFIGKDLAEAREKFKPGQTVCFNV